MAKPAWENTEWKNSANAYENEDFIHIETESGIKGYRFPDPNAPDHILNHDISNEELGKTVLESLRNSRELSLEEAAALDKNQTQRYENYIQKMMSLYGYKSKKALFRKMRYCDMRCKEGVIIICPWHHEKLEAWSGDFITEEDHVKIGADSPPAKIGAALRLAFSRCTGMGALTD